MSLPKNQNCPVNKFRQPNELYSFSAVNRRTFFTEFTRNMCKTIFKNESNRSSSKGWRKNLFKDYLHHIANFCATLLKYGLKKTFLTTPNVQKKFEIGMKHLKLLAKWNGWWQFTWLHNFSELWNNLFFLQYPWKLFPVSFQATHGIYIFSFKKMERRIVRCLKLLIH